MHASECCQWISKLTSEFVTCGAKSDEGLEIEIGAHTQLHILWEAVHARTLAHTERFLQPRDDVRVRERSVDVFNAHEGEELADGEHGARGHCSTRLSGVEISGTDAVKRVARMDVMVRRYRRESVRKGSSRR